MGISLFRNSTNITLKLALFDWRPVHHRRSHRSHRTHGSHHRSHGAHHRRPHAHHRRHRPVRIHHQRRMLHRGQRGRRRHHRRRRTGRGAGRPLHSAGGRRPSQAGRWRYGGSSLGGERILSYFTRFESCRCGVDQMLSLLFHPFLIVELDVVLVFAPGAVGLAHARRVVRKVSVAIIAIVLRHRNKIVASMHAQLSTCKSRLFCYSVAMNNKYLAIIKVFNK